jgi:hypothetical protein
MRVERDPCADCRGPPTETDWVAIFLALAALIYSGAHYIGYEFEYLQHYFHFARSPYVSTIVAVFQRLAIDLISFVLAVLGITLILVLECKKALSSLSYRSWHGSIVGILGGSTAMAEKISQQYDAASNSHHANATLQRFRAARGRLATLLLWGIPMAAVLILFHGPPDFTDSPRARKHDEIRHYMVPSWVILARPENRWQDRSNSHYVPSDEYLVLDKECGSKIQSLGLRSAGLQNSNMVLGSKVEQIETSGSALDALKSEDTAMAGNNDNISAPLVLHDVKHEQVISLTETKTLTRARQ